MNIFFMIIGLIAVIGGVIGVQHDAKEGVLVSIIGTMLFVLCLCDIAIEYGDTCKPTALDVYRGKTTLEITYRDNVAVDSVVVYKMK